MNTAVVSLSGGKDSLATAILALLLYGAPQVQLVWADTGHEHPLTVEYVQDYLPRALGVEVHTVRGDFRADVDAKRLYVEQNWLAAGVPDDIVRRAVEALQPSGNPYLDLCLWKGRFPGRMSQFCTDRLKTDPLNAHMVALARQGLTLESWQGVRRDESEARKDALSWERSDLGWMIYRPIATWNVHQVLQAARAYGVKQNPLYSLGMTRVGCFPCIHCRKSELREIALRFPEEIDRVAEWERLVGDACRRGYATLIPFKTHGAEVSDEEIFRQGNIRARVEWSKTLRGGKELDPQAASELPACSSVYGLCE